jgi:hypothetical protein
MENLFSTKHAEEKIILLQWLSSPNLRAGTACHIFRQQKKRAREEPRRRSSRNGKSL